MTTNKRCTRYYSGRQEKAIAKAVGGKTVANSGATPFHLGDVRTENFLIEAKTCTSEKQSFTIKKEWLEKNEEERFAMHKDYSALAFDFGDGVNYYVISEKLFITLLNLLKEEKEND